MEGKPLNQKKVERHFSQSMCGPCLAHHPNKLKTKQNYIESIWNLNNDWIFSNIKELLNFWYDKLWFCLKEVLIFKEAY